MSKRTYNLLKKTLTSDVRSYSIPADESSETEAKKIILGELLRTEAVTGQGTSDIDYEAVTPKSLLATVSAENISGIIPISSDSSAVLGTNSTRALVASNLSPIFDSRFSKTKSYVLGDIDEVASNYDTLTVHNLSEMVIGKYTDISGDLTFVNNSNVDDIQIVINATQTPLHALGFGANSLEGGRYLALGGHAVTSSGKLKLTLGRVSGFPAGTYRISFSITYYSE